MAIKLTPVESVDAISKEDFTKNYLIPRKPLLITGITQSWPAFQKWTIDYLKSLAGNQTVPLYNNSKVSAEKAVNAPAAHMNFSNYLDLIKSEPTELRIFLFNIFKHVPDLCNDFSYPDLTPGFLKKFPMMFFGGSGSYVFLHYDLDLSHVFITQFHGRKHVMLFSPEYSKNLYKMPFAIHNLEDIDLYNPDYDKYPGLKEVEGLECTMKHGDMLFMPSKWWHFMNYLEGGFALSLRAFDYSLTRKMQGFYNVIVMRQIDNVCRKVFGHKWIEYKEKVAYESGNRSVGKNSRELTFQ